MKSLILKEAFFLMTIITIIISLPFFVSAFDEDPYHKCVDECYSTCFADIAGCYEYCAQDCKHPDFSTSKLQHCSIDYCVSFKQGRSSLSLVSLPIYLSLTLVLSSLFSLTLVLSNLFDQAFNFQMRNAFLNILKRVFERTQKIIFQQLKNLVLSSQKTFQKVHKHFFLKKFIRYLRMFKNIFQIDQLKINYFTSTLKFLRSFDLDYFETNHDFGL